MALPRGAVGWFAVCDDGIPYHTYLLFDYFAEIRYTPKRLLRLWHTVMTASPYEPRHEISNSKVCVTSMGSDQLASTRSLVRAFLVA